jgi:murein DD-endopeptidase MepM/ murein hydrolase activator NlpD
MARRRWTFVIVAEGEANGRQYRLPREVIRLTIALALLLVAAVSSAVTGLVMGGGEGGAAVRLTRRNQLLRNELSQLNSQLDTLRNSVAELQRRDRAFRLIAGLEPITGDVQEVGIGGPDGQSAETRPLWPTDPDAARQAYALSVDLGSLIRRARLLAFSWREAEDSLIEYRERLEFTPSIMPTVGYISSGFSAARMHPILDRPRAHTGLDIVAPYGSPIVAAARGRISYVGQEDGYGLTVEIDHGRGMVTRYAHASRALVKRGQQVARGDTIALVGRSGLAAGPHVHYEVMVNGEPKNPRYYIFNSDIIAD